MIDKNCPACGSPEHGAGIAVPDYEYGVDHTAVYVTCAKCHTVRQTPMPSSERLSSFYPQNYHSQTNQGLLCRFKNKLRFNRLRPWMRSGGAVLDYGCGNGGFLSAAASYMPNCRFYGYEIGQTLKVTKPNDTLTLIEGSHKDLLEILPTCDLITMNHVIEHLPDPREVLSGLYTKLSAGGVLEGQTPAAGCLEQKIFGSRWSGYHAPRHTVVFSPSGLDTLLQKSGFKKIKITPAFNPASLAVSLSTAAHPNPQTGIARQGAAWLFWLCIASLLAPIDLLSGSPSIMNFIAIQRDG